MYFDIGNQRHWISRDLLFNRRGEWCTLNLYTSGYDKWAAGLSWFQQFYTAFDLNYNVVGMAPARLGPLYAQGSHHQIREDV
mmetsp:Transcript_33334/g.51084  ORF Transcript_33334/g.51084 Transcript_33334/m.51084 type:complete len:82 (-) Transcript_33334:22-267(-)